jgi:hypothetical protein
MLSAQDRALSMPEVLEIILLQLPLHDLLVNAQRVSRLFHDIIISSRSLQQALFFRPKRDVSTANVHTNPLLRKKFPPWFKDKWLMPRTFALSDHKHFWRLDWNKSKERREAYARKEASWRRMLVSQPPVLDLHIKLRAEAVGGPSQKKGELRLEDGIRMGLFYDIVQDFIEHQPASYFIIQWYFPPVFEDIDGDMGENDEIKKSSQIKLHLRRVIQFQQGMTGKLGSEFKSLAYEPVDIDYIPVFREPSIVMAYFVTATAIRLQGADTSCFRSPELIGYCLFILNIRVDVLGIYQGAERRTHLEVEAVGISCELFICTNPSLDDNHHDIQSSFRSRHARS